MDMEVQPLQKRTRVGRANSSLKHAQRGRVSIVDWRNNHQARRSLCNNKSLNVRSNDGSDN